MYLVDIFESLNHLNLLLQGKNTNRLNNYDAIRALIAKLALWHCRVQKGNAASFANLDAALEKRNINLKGQLKLEVEFHLKQLKLEFERYFPDLDNTEFPIWKMTRNPFRVAQDILPDNLQEEFLELKCNSTAKDDFQVMPLNDFWPKYMHIYKNVGSAALRILLPFSSTYICESGFSTLVTVKTKYRSKLDCEADMRCALSSTKPRIKLLVSKRQAHLSH